MLMTKEYDKVIILTSITFVTSVIIYVLLGPDYFNLKGDSWETASIVVNSVQILLLFIQIFDNLTQAIAYKCDCIRRPLEIIWNILILAFIALSIMDIFVDDDLHGLQL